MSADKNINQPNETTVAGPVPVGKNVIYDLAALRKHHAIEVNDNVSIVSPVCSDGVCVLSWRPRKPCNDAA